MKKKLYRFVLFFIATLVFSSCSGDISQSPQTTKADSLGTTTEQSTTAVDPIRETATPREPIPQPNDIGYYEGVVTITQYYTFLGHGLYEEAYQLLSSSARQHSPSLEEYVENGKRWFRKVEIITIIPHQVYVKEQGGQLRSFETMNERRFYVQIIAWGEGKMSGSRLSGEVQTLLLTLVKEDGEWRIGR